MPKAVKKGLNFDCRLAERFRSSVITTGVKKLRQLVFLCPFFALPLHAETAANIAAETHHQAQNQLAKLPLFPKKARQHLTRGLYAPHFELDPHQAKTAAERAVLRDLFVGLMQFNATGNVVPALAQKWLTEDGKRWLFVLDENARWSNGERVTAQDVVLSWQRLADPKNQSPFAEYLMALGLENAQTVLLGQLPPEALGLAMVEPHLLEIQLEHTNYQLPKMLAHAALLPSFQGKVPNLANLISNGDYRLAGFSDQKLQLQAVSPDTPFQSVDYQLLNARSDFSRLDLLENPPEAFQTNLSRWSLPRMCSYFYEFNLHDPDLAKKPVRQAIQAMLKANFIQQNLGVENHSILPRQLHLEEEDQWKRSPIAEQLLFEAGASPQNPVRLTLTFDGNEHRAIAHQLIRALGQSDLFVIQPDEVSTEVLHARREQGQFQFIRSGFCASYPDASPFLWRFHSQSLDNQIGYHNPEIDHQLERLQQEALTDAERANLIYQITEQLEAEVVILPLFQQQRRIYLDPSLAGLDENNQSEVILSRDLYRKMP